MAVFLHHGLGHAHLHVGGGRAQDALLEEIRANLLAHHMDGDDVELQLLELVVLLEEIARRHIAETGLVLVELDHSLHS